jgi:hypothetical protein
MLSSIVSNDIWQFIPWTHPLVVTLSVVPSIHSLSALRQALEHVPIQVSGEGTYDRLHSKGCTHSISSLRSEQYRSNGRSPLSVPATKSVSSSTIGRRYHTKRHLDLVGNTFNTHKSELRGICVREFSRNFPLSYITATTVTIGIMPQPSSLTKVNGSANRYIDTICFKWMVSANGMCRKLWLQYWIPTHALGTHMP